MIDCFPFVLKHFGYDWKNTVFAGLYLAILDIECVSVNQQFLFYKQTCSAAAGHTDKLLVIFITAIQKLLE